MQWVRAMFASLFIFGIFVFVPNHVFADTTFQIAGELQNLAVANGGTYTLDIAGSPYIFITGIHVNKDITINVDPGVKIILGLNRNIQFFDGTFNANGTVDNPITITSNSSYYGQLYFGSNINDVKANLTNVIFTDGNWCNIIGRSTVVYKNVTFHNCKTLPFSISLTPGTNVIMDNITYVKSHNPVNNTLFFMGPGEGIDSLHPVNVEIKNSTFPQDGSPIFKIIDHTIDGSYDPNFLTLKINNNNFTGLVQNAHIFNVDEASKKIKINAEDNYWMDPSGPYVSGTLPKTNGPGIPSNIDFIPFKTRDPSTILECCSSVLFVPGIEGSRLYKDKLLGGVDQLWEANWKSDLTDLALDQNGNSLNQNIYTKDIINRTNIGSNVGLSSYDKDEYKNTSLYLQNQKDTNIINSYSIYPYDWRLDFDTIINNGTKMDDGSYAKLVNILHEQSNLSNTGKVTIVSHSMGGLLTKRFIQSLNEQDQSLIDKVVFISVPQIGTPNGTTALLHGLEFTGFYKNLSPQRYVRQLTKNMISAQTLGVSNNYFNIVNDSPIIFNNNLSNLLPEVATYGVSIDSDAEMQSFLKGLDGRNDALFADVNYPDILQTYTVNRAKELHDTMDNYNIPENIKVTQIAGTGIPTIKQIEYLEKTNLLGKYIGYNLKNSLSGDGTVVKESASYLSTDAYYINLNKYNTDTQGNHGHQDMSGITPVTNIISNIIKNENINIDTYISTTGDLFDTVKLFTLGMHSPVDIHIYDALNNHTGPVYVDINGEVIKFIEENIPNMSYNEHGEDKYITGLDNQNYIVKLDGYDAGSFTLDLQRYIGDTPTTYESFNDLPSTDLLDSTINLNQDLPIGNILIDVNGDTLPDLQANNDGTVIDLNKIQDEDCKIKKEKDNNKDKDKEKNKKCKKEKDEKKDKDKKKDKKEHDKVSKKYHDKEKGKHY